MINRLPLLLRRAKQIFQTEGLILLVRQGFPFLFSFFFRYKRYYLYETDVQEILKERNEADFLPRIDSFDFRIVHTNQEADELEAEGLEFRSQVNNARHRLDKGAVTFCIFVGQELAYYGWIATTEAAMKALGEPPLRVDFANNEACGADVWTNPKHRGKGLAPFADFKTYQFLQQIGRVVHRASTLTSNVSSQKAWAKLGHPKIHAEARYLKILWWKSWKEKPLT